ncbi:MAG: hypothetical protein E7028_08905 [Planctomycetaceae bacterium]|nr:hypothetical protein [Planctomycetaceae bacterium]
METGNRNEKSFPNENFASSSKETSERSHPPRGLIFFTLSLLALIVVMKLVSCTALSKIDVMEEIKKSHDAPQLRIINN